MKKTVNNLLDIARSQIGYHEKASNSNLDSPTANSGDNNYTKYARDLAQAGYYQSNKNGYQWCDVFVDWNFLQLCGNRQEAEKMTCQTGLYGAGCDWSARYYKEQKRFSTNNPQPGDQIFFRKFSHTGLIEKVENGVIYTIEGNSTNQVERCQYSINSSKIDGFGHPFYEQEEGTQPTPEITSYELEDFIRDVQKACGAHIDGIAGPETLRKTVTVSKDKNRTHDVVIPLQKRLMSLGYSEVGPADGCTGPKFEKAVKHFQKDHSRYVDGIITAENITWKKLLGMDENSKPENTYSKEQFIRDVQKSCGARVDGIYGPETINKTVTLSRNQNVTHPVVKYVQRRLMSLGYTEVGKIDGYIGPKFEKAVINFQTNYTPYKDGIISAKQITWQKLLTI